MKAEAEECRLLSNTLDEHDQVSNTVISKAMDTNDDTASPIEGISDLKAKL